MESLLRFLTVATLAIAIYGQNRCSVHTHCRDDHYCDTSTQTCKKGIRKCSSDTAYYDCGYWKICKEGVCQKGECRRHTDCPGNQACKFPPGICKDYEQYCRYNGYCKAGYVCVNKRCKKRECNDNYNCKLGNKCVGGFCKPIPGFCSDDSDCDKNQCCAKAGKNKHGLCKSMSKPGDDWCPLKPTVQDCPCVSGYVCEKTTSSYYWGKCTAIDGGSGSGSGSDDF